jgi:hypothetical protein
MTTQTTRLSTFMKLSWDIQKRKEKLNRSKALQAAWAILNNEEITLRYMARYVQHNRHFGIQLFNQLGLFND